MGTRSPSRRCQLRTAVSRSIRSPSGILTVIPTPSTGSPAPATRYATPSPFSPPWPGRHASGRASPNRYGPSSDSRPAGGFSPRQAKAPRDPAQPPGSRSRTPGPARHDDTNIRHRGVTVNTTTSPCTPTHAARHHRKRGRHGHFECRATPARSKRKRFRSGLSGLNLVLPVCKRPVGQTSAATPLSRFQSRI
jgi:hypothetical protein